MKKALFVLVAFSLIFMGCEKEGMYNPSKKIKRVSEQGQGSVKQLASEWTWEKNLLTKVQYFKGNSTPDYDERYTYEKKQVVKVDRSDGAYWKINYKDNLYDKIECYAPNGMTIVSIRVTYENKKVSKLDYTFFDYDKALALFSDGGFISTIFSTETLQGMQKMMSKSKKGTNTYTYSMTFTYDGNNIKEQIMKIIEEDYSITMTYKFEKYDTNLNPLYHSFQALTGSKNNPLEVIAEINVYIFEIEESDYERLTISYDYYYDGKFPKEIVAVEKDSDGSTYRFTTYYDYQ